jgi:hypothetical protein
VVGQVDHAEETSALEAPGPAEDEARSTAGEAAGDRPSGGRGWLRGRRPWLEETAVLEAPGPAEDDAR